MQFSFHSISRRVAAWSTAVMLCATAAAFLTSCKKDTEAGKTPADQVTPPGKTAPDLSTPKKAGLAFATALDAGDTETLRKTSIGTDAQFAPVKGMGDMIAAMKRYNVVAIKKFGDKGKLPGEAIPEVTADVQKTEEKIDGDKATLVDKAKPDEKYPLTLKKDGSTWKVDLSIMDPDMVKIGNSSKKVAEVVDAVIKDVETGKLKTAEEATAALKAAMGAAMGAPPQPRRPRRNNGPQG